MGNFTSSYFIRKSVCTEVWKGPHSHRFAAVINYGSALTGQGRCAWSSHMLSLKTTPPHPLPGASPDVQCLMGWLGSRGQWMKHLSLWLWFANWTNTACGLSYILSYSFFPDSPPRTYFLVKQVAGLVLRWLSGAAWPGCKWKLPAWFLGFYFLKAQASGVRF